MSNKKILVVGSINIDLVYELENLPKKGETVLSKNFSLHNGGKGLNQAYSIAQMDGKVEFIGSIGDDQYGIDYLNFLRTYQKIKFDRMLIQKNTKTGNAIILVDKNGDNNIIVSQNANKEFKSKDFEILKMAIDDSDIIVLQLEIPFNIVKSIVEYASINSKIIILNPSPIITLEDEFLNKIDYLILNEVELKRLDKNLDESNYEKSLINFYKTKKIKNILLTLGDKGSYLVNDNEVLFVKALKVNAVDTTSAGDSYLGAFVSAISKNWDNRKAINFANKVASITVTRHGALDSIPSINEIDY